MNITQITSLAIPDVKIITYSRFTDQRGYFTEQFRESDMIKVDGKHFTKDLRVVQANESYSKKHTLRGLHFQWNPYMGKLVRTVFGHMIDIVLDVRRNSPTLGKAIMIDMPADKNISTAGWVWVPPGFAHGNVFLDETLIEYLCTGEYSQGHEAGVSPLASDIDWSLCDKTLYTNFQKIVKLGPIITDKDRNAYALKEWLNDKRSENFIYGKC